MTVSPFSLLKCMAGVWQPTSGAVAAPPRDAFVYLPQRPYIAPFLTFREQLTYPQPGSALSASAVAAAVEFAGLQSVVAACGGGLDEPCDVRKWAGLSMVSAGARAVTFGATA